MAVDPPAAGSAGDDDNGLGARVDSWLDTAGAALELRTERALARVGFATRHSSYYDDPVTAKAREVDVVASQQGWTSRGGHSLDIVVECKSSADYPWALFETRNSLNEALTDLMATRLVRGVGPGARELRPPPAVGLDCPLLAPFGVTVAYSAKATASKVDVVHQAVGQVLSAATAVADAAAKGRAKEARPESTFVLVVPVLVTAAPLFAVRLANDGTVARRRVDHALLLVREGRPASASPAGVWLWDADALDELAAAAEATATGMTVV